MNPKRLLTPALSSFLGRRGRRDLGLQTVSEYIARNGIKGISRLRRGKKGTDSYKYSLGCLCGRLFVNTVHRIKAIF